MARGGLGRLEKGTAIGVVVYDQSMKMDGPCAVNRCRTDGNWKMKSFFWIFWALVGLLPAGDMCNF